MQLSRPAFLAGTFLAGQGMLLPSEDLFVAKNSLQPTTPAVRTNLALPKASQRPHVAAGGQADDNPTVFGAILRGELPAVCLAETDRLLAFLDRYPKAPFHALVIPKRFLPSVFDLTQADLPMLYDMKAMAEQVLEERGYPLSDSRLVFHVPPFNSVQHLHLHVLAPASEMGWHAALLEYPPSETRRCTRYASVVSRLERGRPAVPYARPAPPLLLRFFGTDLLPKVKNRRQGED